VWVVRKSECKGIRVRIGGNGQREDKLVNFWEFSQGGANSKLPINLTHRLTARGLPPSAIVEVAILA